MKKYLEKKEYPDGTTVVNWELPRGLFKFVGCLGYGIIIAGTFFAIAGNEQANQLINTCKCAPWTLLGVSTLCLKTGMKK